MRFVIILLFLTNGLFISSCVQNKEKESFEDDDKKEEFVLDSTNFLLKEKIYRDFWIDMSVNEYEYFENIYIEKGLFKKKHSIKTVINKDTVYFTPKFQEDKLISIVLKYPLYQPTNKSSEFRFGKITSTIGKEDYTSTFKELIDAYTKKYGNYRKTKGEIKNHLLFLGFEGEEVNLEEGFEQVGESYTISYYWRISSGVIEINTRCIIVYKYTSSKGYLPFSEEISSISILYTSYENYQHVLNERKRIIEEEKKKKREDSEKILDDI